MADPGEGPPCIYTKLRPKGPKTIFFFLDSPPSPHPAPHPATGEYVSI